MKRIIPILLALTILLAGVLKDVVNGSVEVIGNIYENPELLKEVENEEKLFSGR